MHRTQAEGGGVLESLVNGEYDAYLNAWISPLEGFISNSEDGAVRRRMYLLPFHEMNAPWQDWYSCGSDAVGNTEEAGCGASTDMFKKAWIKLVRV
jgi:beta-mannanase